MQFKRLISRIAYFLVAIVVMAGLASLGAVVFFVMLGILATLAIFHAFRTKGVMGASRDSAFTFNRENFKVHPKPATVIEGEYQEVQATREEQRG